MAIFCLSSGDKGNMTAKISASVTKCYRVLGQFHVNWDR